MQSQEGRDLWLCGGLCAAKPPFLDTSEGKIHWWNVAQAPGIQFQASTSAGKMKPGS